jgi:predicted transcriptional regulator
MYNVNLNYSQLKMHMDSLTAQGLLVKQINKFSSTEKGHEFLYLFVRLNGLVDDLNP